MRVGGLFSGIGGIELGLERAGMEIAWHVEIEPWCRHILKKHWPDVPCYDDIRTVRGREVESVDVLCGGFPCQDISVAGRGDGIEGARSSLWKEYARLVDEIRPRYVIVENVAVLRRRGLDVVLGDLSSLGYDAEWDCLRASDFGAPHRRDRFWLVAYPQREQLRDESGRCRGTDRQGPSLAPVDGAARTVADATGAGRQASACHGLRAVAGPGQGSPSRADRPRDVADADNAGRCERRGAGAVPPQLAAVERGREDESRRVFGHWDGPSDAWLVEPDVGRVADGIPARVHRLRGLGNAVVPQIPQWIGERILAFEALESGVDTDQEGVAA